MAPLREAVVDRADALRDDPRIIAMVKEHNADSPRASPSSKGTGQARYDARVESMLDVRGARWLITTGGCCDISAESAPVANTPHDALHGILRKLPSDFEPWGLRSRENDWGPDCSCGCRWFVRLHADLNHDWGLCSNPGSPRCGLLTFEHQGCREFEGSEEHDWLRSREGDGAAPPENDRKAEVVLLKNLAFYRAELTVLLEDCTSHWGFEDPIYRFYHQSFKVFGLQERTRAIVTRLRGLVPDRSLSLRFLAIVEAFLHARFFLEMAVRYAQLDRPPNPLPSGYAALLCLYGLR